MKLTSGVLVFSLMNISWTDIVAVEHLMPVPSTRWTSTIGREGGPQDVSLENSSCIKFYLIRQEMMHTIGFHPEHNRSDRDKYIEVRYENILPGKVHYFDKADTNNLGTACDYCSITHVGKYMWKATYQRPWKFLLPNYPALYPNNVQCKWMIRSPSAMKIRFEVATFNLKKSKDCADFYLLIRNVSRGPPIVKERICTDKPKSMAVEKALLVEFYHRGQRSGQDLKQSIKLF